MNYCGMLVPRPVPHGFYLPTTNCKNPEACTFDPASNNGNTSGPIVLFSHIWLARITYHSIHPLSPLAYTSHDLTNNILNFLPRFQLDSQSINPFVICQLHTSFSSSRLIIMQLNLALKCHPFIPSAPCPSTPLIFLWIDKCLVSLVASLVSISTSTHVNCASLCT